MELTFGGKSGSAAKPAAVKSDFGSSKLYVWVKGLETKVNNLLREVEMLKTDFIKKSNEMKKDLKTMNVDVMEMKHDQEKTLEKMDLIIKELKKTAGMEEVETLKKYLDLWSPLNFVTQRDLDRAVDAKFEEVNRRNNLNQKETDSAGMKTNLTETGQPVQVKSVGSTKERHSPFN